MVLFEFFQRLPEEPKIARESSATSFFGIFLVSSA